MTQVTLIGGYGQVGARVAHLLGEPGSLRLVIAGRDEARAADTAARLNGRAIARYADVDRGDGLAAAIDGSSLVVVMAPCHSGVTKIAQACVSAGADYVDILSGDRLLRELDAIARLPQGSNRLFVTHAGVGAGLPSTLVRAVAGEFDGCRHVRVGVWISLQGVTRPADAFDIVDAVAGNVPQVYRSGQWRVVSRARERVTIHFGHDFGSRTCLPIDVPELHGLPERLGLLGLQGFAATPNWRADLLFRSIVNLAYGARPGLGRTQFARLLLAVARRAAPRPGGCLIADAWDQNGRRHYTRRISHTDIFDWTAAVVAGFVGQYVTGALNAATGVRMMGHIVDAPALLTSLRMRGMQSDSIEHKAAR